jgi:antitoxin (DNA-binding transcriptional repressor) of toxin-antitoxin stability system
MQRVGLDEAKVRLLDLIDAAVNGEEVFIGEDDHLVVRLVPVVRRGRPRFGSARGLVEVSEDFDDPIEDFEEYSG